MGNMAKQTFRQWPKRVINKMLKDTKRKSITFNKVYNILKEKTK